MKNTDTRAAILAWIREFTRNHGYSPTVREIAAAHDTCISNAQYHIDALDKSGAITRTKGKARSIRVVPSRVKHTGRETHNERQYLNLLRRVLVDGQQSEDRTGTGTLSVFGTQTRYDLRESFPLLTTKKMFFKGVVAELLWMLCGETNIQPLQDQGVHIWDEWADVHGELGPVYGAQWRDWGGKGIDQIMDVIDSIKRTPFSRRHIVSAWNASDVPFMALPPCHMMFQFYVRGGRLSCHMYQRSGDLFLGVPFNIASYALLTHMIAQVCELKVGELVHTIGDAHIYDNHRSQVITQLSRQPKPGPQIRLTSGIDDIDMFRREHVQLVGYDYHPMIKAKVAV